LYYFHCSVFFDNKQEYFVFTISLQPSEYHRHIYLQSVPPMKRSLSAILLLSFLLTSCGKEVVSTPESSKDIKYVKTEKLEKKGFMENLKLIGKVASLEQTIISPLSSGTIKTIKVEV